MHRRRNTESMGCDSCPESYIKYNTNCYLEKDSTQKTFYMPESTTEIKSCFELSGYYILENTYECIHSDSKPETG